MLSRALRLLRARIQIPERLRGFLVLRSFREHLEIRSDGVFNAIFFQEPLGAIQKFIDVCGHPSLCLFGNPGSLAAPSLGPRPSHPSRITSSNYILPAKRGQKNVRQVMWYAPPCRGSTKHNPRPAYDLAVDINRCLAW